MKHSQLLRRITIYGSICAGKSIFALQLGQLLGKKVIELDYLFYSLKGIKSPLKIFKERISEIVQEEDWIFDGNFSMARPLVLNRATFVIILNMPLFVIWWRAIARTISYYTRLRLISTAHLQVDLPKSGFKEILKIIIDLIFSAWKFKKSWFHCIFEESKSAVSSKNVVIFNAPKELERFSQLLKRNFNNYQEI